MKNILLNSILLKCNINNKINNTKTNNKYN